MPTVPRMPPQAAIAVNDLLDNCAQIQAGQHVLILAATDGLYGGWNIVDEQAISWIQAAVQQRGAHPSVLWVDMPVRRTVIWPDIPTRSTVWRVPPVVKNALKGADVLISHILDLSTEEELKEWPELLRDTGLPMIRNMATTAPLLTSAWARTPHELVCELRYRTAELIVPGERWLFTHPNGTHLEGTVGPPVQGGGQYAQWRSDGFYRPFPEGIYPAVNPPDTEGMLVFDRLMPVWARHIGIPPEFSRPVHITVEKNHMVKFEGGPEASKLRGFFAELAKQLGEEDAYEIRAPHGGIHPCALLTPWQCPDEDYRQFIASFHPSSVHMHLGQGRHHADFPYSLHPSPELRGCTLTIGGKVVHDNGRLGVLDHPSVQAIAAKYPDRPGLDGDRWL